MSAADLEKIYRCYVTDEIIPHARVEYLLSEGTPEHMLTSISGSNKVYKPRKMLVLDEHSSYMFCKSIDEERLYFDERFSDEEPEEKELSESEIEATEKCRKKQEAISKETEDEI